MAKVKFYAIESTAYKGITPDANSLYFLTDTKEIFRGSVKYSQAVEFVTSFPEASAAKVGVIYVDGNNNASVSNGTTWVPFVSQQYSFQFRDAYSESATYNAGDVVTYNGAMFKANGTPAVGTAPVNASGVVNAGWVAMVANGTITGVSYANNVLTFTDNNGKAQTINLPAENFLSNASFDSATNVLTLTLTDNSTVTVNLADLVEYNTVGNTDSIELSQDAAHKITAAVKISATAGNKVVVNNDGIFVGKDNVGTGKDNEILTANAAGEMQASGKKVGGETFAATPDVNTVATEKAAKTYADSVVNLGSDNANEIVTVGSDGKIAASDKKIGTNELAASPDANTLATEAAVQKAVEDGVSGFNVGEGNADEILIADAEGKPVASDKKIGGETFAETTDANTLATEAGTEAAIEAALTWQTA